MAVVWVVDPDTDPGDESVVAAAVDAGASSIVEGLPSALEPFVPDPRPGYPFAVTVPDPVPPPAPVEVVSPDVVRIRQLAAEDTLTADEQSEAVLLLLRRFV